MSDRQFVTHIYFLEIPRKNTAKFFKNWEKEAPHLKRTPGLMDIKLFSEIGKSKKGQLSQWFILAEWESIENFEAALSQEKFSYFFREWEIKVGEPALTLIKETEEKQAPKRSFFKRLFSTNGILIMAWFFGIIFAFLILVVR